MFSFVRTSSKWSLKIVVPFFIPTSNEWESYCCTSSTALMVSVFWDFGRSNRCVVISYCYFNLHCPEDMWCRCRASFYILICYLLSWLVKILLRFLAHVLCCLFSYCFIFKNSLHILYKFFMRYFFYNIFSQDMACLLILLILTFIQQIFLKWSLMYQLFLSWIMPLVF